MPHYELVPDNDLARVLEIALQAPAGVVTREGSCFLASVSAAHILNSLAVAGFIVMRPDDRILRLDV